MKMTSKVSIWEKIFIFLIPQKKDSKSIIVRKICFLVGIVALLTVIVACIIQIFSFKSVEVINDPKHHLASQAVASSLVSSQISADTSSKVSSEVSSKVSSEVSSKVSSEANAQVSSNSTSSKPAVKQQTKPTTVDTSDFLPKFQEWYKKNPDIKGHLVIPLTNVNYPVTQGKNNTFYLNHNEYKASYCWGIPYMDYRVKIGKDGNNSKNIMMYGHGDDKRGLMLSNMKKYRDVNFYKEHPVIQFDTLYDENQWKVITMFKEDTNPKRGSKIFEFWNSINLNTESAFNAYISAVKQRAFFTSTVDVDPSDQLISIQVCENTNISNYNRLVLVCRRVRDGEEATVDTSEAKQNEQK